MGSFAGSMICMHNAKTTGKVPGKHMLQGFVYERAKQLEIQSGHYRVYILGGRVSYRTLFLRVSVCRHLHTMDKTYLDDCPLDNKVSYSCVESLLTQCTVDMIG
jgi:hypothetical protein